MTFGTRSVQLLCSESTTSELVHASLLAACALGCSGGRQQHVNTYVQLTMILQARSYGQQPLYLQTMWLQILAF